MRHAQVLIFALPLFGCHQLGDDDATAPTPTDQPTPTTTSTPPPVPNNYGVGPGQCWGDDGLPSNIDPPLTHPDCGGNSDLLPDCLFDPAVYGSEQTGTWDLFDLAAITDPHAASLSLHILNVQPYGNGDAWLVDLSFQNGHWFTDDINLTGTLAIPGPTMNHAEMLMGGGFYMGATVQSAAQSMANFGVPAMTLTDQAGLRQMNYDALVALDPELFHAIRNSPLISDEDRDLCLTAEPGDGCISGPNPPTSVNALRHCATAIASYTGNMHWSFPMVISANQIRARSAAAAALHSLASTDPANPGPEWSLYAGDLQQAVNLEQALLDMGADNTTPFFERPVFFGCSKNGWALKAVSLLEDRTLGITPHCIPWDTPDYFQSELDVWPGGVLGSDYLTGDPASSFAYMASPEGLEYLQASSLTPNTDELIARGVHVLFGFGANDPYAPVTSPDYFMPDLWAANPTLSLGLYAKPNAGHGGRDQAALNLFLDASYSNRQLPRASLCLRDNGNGNRELELSIDWKDYSAVATSATAQLWYTEDYNGFASNPAAAHCPNASATTGHLGNLDMRCSGYTSTNPVPTSPSPTVWTNIDALPTQGTLPHRAFFATVTATIPGHSVPMSFSAPPQIIPAVGQTPFHPDAPGGYHSCL